jgi:hypothetical protein
MDQEDMAEVCRKFKIQVPGFQRNMTNAPKQLMENEIKNRWYNALAKKKRKAIKYEDMLKEIAKDTLQKYDYLQELSFDEFVMKIETDVDIKPYQAVAVLHEKFPELYETKKETMIQNTKARVFVFRGISDTADRPTIEKIHSIVENSLKLETVYQQLLRYETELPEEYQKFKEKINGDEEKLLNTLLITPKEYIAPMILAFLLEDDNYKKAEYKYLLKFVENVFESKRAKKLKEELEEALKKIEDLTKRVQELLGIESEIEKLTDQIKFLSNEKYELNKEKEKLYYIVKQQEPIFQYFDRILKNREIMIITDDVDKFIGTPFEEKVIHRKAFLKDKRQKNLEHYREKRLFFTRSSFDTKEWGQLKIFLENQDLRYYEVGHYDVVSYIEEIIEHLIREEKELEYEQLC